MHLHPLSRGPGSRHPSALFPSMNRPTPLDVLALSQLTVIGAALALHLRVRGDLLARNLSPEAQDRLSVAGWLVPCSVALGTVVMLLALFQKRGRSRLELVAVGLVVSPLPAVVITLLVFAAIFAG